MKRVQCLHLMMLTRKQNAAFEIIQKALQDLGADTSCVVRTRMFVTDITLWAEFGRAPVRILWRKSARYKYNCRQLY
jgi:enamine deaminase RidA (YjgF/YER057c/UK114 family)